MDSAYEGNETRALVRKPGFIPVVPPNPRRRKPWKPDRRRYKQRNHVERLFRRLKGFRRLATRYDKLAVMFSAYIFLALIYIALQ
jgi:transposase